MDTSVKSSGFTIIELLAVIVVIAILASISLVSYNGIQNRAAHTVLLGDAKQATTKLLLYYSDNGTFPLDETLLGDASEIEASEGVTFQYSATPATYCLTVTHKRVGVQSVYVSNSSLSPREGACENHLTSEELANDTGNVNVARGAAVTVSQDPYNGKKHITDGVKATAPYHDGGSGVAWVQVDLGQNRVIGNVKIWRYFNDTRQYKDMVTQVSLDGVQWTTIFDGKTEGLYNETSQGKSITFSPRSIRYIRDTTNGSTRNTSNHWVEIEAYRR